MKALFSAVFVTFLLSFAAFADEPQRVVPITHEWVVMPCASWSEAVAALVAAEGDPNVIALPTTHTEHKWVILKRVVSGGYVPPPDMPWSLEAFAIPSDASNRMSALSKSHCPLMFTTTDDRAVVVFLRNPEKRTRAVRH